MTGYVTLTKKEFEKGLARIVSQLNQQVVSIQEKNQFGVEEYVYILKTKNPAAHIKVYSSISKRNNFSRKIGQDAIRCVVEYQGKDVFKGTTHTKRIATWEKNLSNKIAELSANIAGLKFCPKCKSVLTIRRGPKNKFWGCSSFPKCRHSESL